LFSEKEAAVGKCPRCGFPVVEREKVFTCQNNACSFYLYKEADFFAKKRKSITSEVAAALLNDGKVNGYPFFMSNAIPSNLTKGSSSGVCSAIVFGNWSEVLVGSWGGLQIIVDPYTAKANGVLEISAAAYHDVLVRTPQAFCKIVDITTV
jgi:hypothetical protein